MTHHVPDELLHAFVDGEVDEAVAIHVAEHLDGCPVCATRVATLEPLAAAFAAVTDPVPRVDLAARVMVELARTDDVPKPVEDGSAPIELAIGGLLLAAAATLAVAGGDPLGALVRLGVLAGAMSTAGAQLSFLANGPVLTLAMTTLAIGAAALVAARTSWTDESVT